MESLPAVRNYHTIMHRLTIFIILGFAFCQYTAIGCQNDECHLFENLFANYSRPTRPVKNVSLPINISVSLEIVYLNDLDETPHLFSTFSSLQLQWHDEFLTWKPENYGGIKKVAISPLSIWVPDLRVENKYDSLSSDPLVPQSDNAEKALLESDGKVFLERNGILETKCWVEMTHFPFDKHLCTITLASNADTTSAVTLQRLGYRELVSNEAFNNQYGLESYCFEFGEMTRPNREDKFSYFHLAVLFARRPMVHLWTLWLPIILLALVAMLVFALPADAGEKISLGITVNLSFTVFQATVQDLLPNNTNNTPIIALFVGLVMFLTTLSLIMTIIVLRMHHSSEYPPPPHSLLVFIKAIDPWHNGNNGKAKPKTTRLNFFKPSFIQDRTNGNRRSEVRNVSSKTADAGSVALGESPKTNEISYDWKHVARVLDRLFLATFLMVLAIAVTVSLFLCFVGEKKVLDGNQFPCNDWRQLD